VDRSQTLQAYRNTGTSLRQLLPPYVLAGVKMKFVMSLYECFVLGLPPEIELGYL